MLFYNDTQNNPKNLKGDQLIKSYLNTGRIDNIIYEI
jgi:hypothetical protein